MEASEKDANFKKKCEELQRKCEELQQRNNVLEEQLVKVAKKSEIYRNALITLAGEVNI